MYLHDIRSLFGLPGYVVEEITTAVDIAQVPRRRDKPLRPACIQCAAAVAADKAQPTVSFGR